MPAARSTRSKASSSPVKRLSKLKNAVKSKIKPKPKANLKTAARDDDVDDDLYPDESSDDEGDNYEEPGSAEESDADDEDGGKSMDSDALDDEESIGKSRKRKRAAPSKKSPRKASPRKKTKAAVSEDEEDDDFDLKEGQEVVGTVVQAPKTGRVPPGQISKNTFDFLTKLKNPKCNDRDWFKLHEPIYRVAEQEWKDFVEEFTTTLVDEVDNQIPQLPPKDAIMRIYRDVRFSNDKTPYKKNFSAHFSRGGRKGIFAAYYIQIQPGNGSFLAAGVWCPAKNELQTLRSNIQHSSAHFRSSLSAPEFVEKFGEPKPLKKTKAKSTKNGDDYDDFGMTRNSIFGRDDELKVAPKGIDKNHPDIDLLKCRSFAVVHGFTDAQVLAPDFKEELGKVALVAQPFVRCLNDMITLPVNNDDEDEDGSEG